MDWRERCLFVVWLQFLSQTIHLDTRLDSRIYVPISSFIYSYHCASLLDSLRRVLSIITASTNQLEDQCIGPFI